MEMQASFVSNIQITYGETGKAWLKALPIHLASLSRMWDLTIIHPLPNLSYNYVALVKSNVTQEQMVLKISPKNKENNIIREARWLQYFEKGVPRIFNVDVEHNAYLMERLSPGETLKTLVQKGRDEEATRIISQIILNLQSKKQPILSFKPFVELSESLPLLKGHVSPLMLSKAISLFHDLSYDSTQHILLHGDLHHENILQSDATWKTIDPHGYIGDPVAEVGPMIHNPHGAFPADKPLKNVIDSRLKVLTELLPFDPHRVKAWAFCITLLSAAWDVEENGTISHHKIDIASTIDKTV